MEDLNEEMVREWLECDRIARENQNQLLELTLPLYPDYLTHSPYAEEKSSNDEPERGVCIIQM